jgi:hypothetical protein
MPKKPDLYIIPGGLTPHFLIGELQLVPATLRNPPFPVTATIVEEDIWRVLSSEPLLHPGNEHPVRLMTDLVSDRPARPGSVLIKKQRWLVIVYDLEQEPSCKEEWVLQALDGILELATTKHIRSLALPLLGCRHGGISRQRSLDLILDRLSGLNSGGYPKRIWLQITADQRDDIQHRLSRRFQRK